MKSQSFLKVAVFAFVCGLFGFDSVKAGDDFTYVYTGSVAPTTHTHTCYNAACPVRVDTGYVNSWDHKTNAGHECQFCGVTVTIQDTRPQRVNLFARMANRVERRVERKEWNPPACKSVSWNPPVVRGMVAVPFVGTVEVKQVVQYTLTPGNLSFGGCSGPGCSTSSAQDTGIWFPGKGIVKALRR